MDALGEVLDILRCPHCARRLERADAALRCNAGHAVGWRGDYLDCIDTPEHVSLGQRVFMSATGANVYERLREGPLASIVTGTRFSRESEWLLDAVFRKGAPRIVLDVPCGQGNFTAALARRSRGIVIGVDLSARMLELASRRLRALRLDNVVLLRASALALPIVSGGVDAVSSCGGLHLYPDAARAIGEMRRVLRDGGVAAGLTFRSTGALRPLEPLALRFGGVRAFDFDALGAAFGDAGFVDWRWQGRRLVGWFTARAEIPDAAA